MTPHTFRELRKACTAADPRGTVSGMMKNLQQAKAVELRFALEATSKIAYSWLSRKQAKALFGGRDAFESCFQE